MERSWKTCQVEVFAKIPKWIQEQQDFSIFLSSKDPIWNPFRELLNTLTLHDFSASGSKYHYGLWSYFAGMLRLPTKVIGASCSQATFFGCQTGWKMVAGAANCSVPSGS